MYYTTVLFMVCLLSYTKSYIKYISPRYIRYSVLKKSVKNNFAPNLNISILNKRSKNNTIEPNEDWESGEVPWTFTDKNIDSEDSWLMFDPSSIIHLF